MKYTTTTSLSFVTVLAMWTCLLAGAQSTTGRIYGTVADPSGAAVPDAKVVITDIHTKLQQAATTNGSGEFVFPNFARSDYTVTSSAVGFKSETQTGVALAANQNVHVEFALPVGQVSDTVEVQAAVTLVDTREAQLGETIDQEKIENLPTLNRDVISLVTITPGVTSDTADSQIGSRNGSTFSSNGLATDMESFYLDGSFNNVFKSNAGNKFPNPDALQEFRILSSNFDTEFGRAPAAVVNAITRSGTDHFHGTAYDYLRNNILNARNYFVLANAPAVKLQQNQFGATFGGPMPALRKTFFFLSYQGLVLRQDNVVTAGTIQTLTALERSGDFSEDAAAKVFNTTTFKKPNLAMIDTYNARTNPTGNGLCPGAVASGKICAAALDAVAQGVLKFMPVGSVPAVGSFNHASRH